MSRRLFIAMLGFSLALYLMPQISLAEEDHIDEAIRHTKQAIVQGHAGHSDSFLDHAKEALVEARAAEYANANPHCQRRRDFAAAGRSNSAAGTQARRPPISGAFLLVAFHS